MPLQAIQLEASGKLTAHGSGLQEHSPSDQIRIAQEAGIQLSPKTRDLLRKPSQRTCVNCQTPYTPSCNSQKYCERCRIAREKTSLPLYKRKKARISARLKSNKKLKEKLSVQLANVDRTIASLESELRDTHLWQFPPIAQRRRLPLAEFLQLIPRDYATQLRQLIRLRRQARGLARRLATMHRKNERRRAERRDTGF